MQCACNANRDSIVYCERHAIEQKRRTKIVAADLAHVGEAMREDLRRRAGSDPTAVALEQDWLAALRRAKEAV